MVANPGMLPHLSQSISQQAAVSHSWSPRQPAIPAEIIPLQQYQLYHSDTPPQTKYPQVPATATPAKIIPLHLYQLYRLCHIHYNKLNTHIPAKIIPIRLYQLNPRNSQLQLYLLKLYLYSYTGYTGFTDMHDTKNYAPTTASHAISANIILTPHYSSHILP